MNNPLGSIYTLYNSIGIGTAAPKQSLHLQKSADENNVRIDAGTNAYSGIMLCKQSDSNGYHITYDTSSADKLYVGRMSSGARGTNFLR